MKHRLDSASQLGPVVRATRKALRSARMMRPAPLASVRTFWGRLSVAMTPFNGASSSRSWSSWVSACTPTFRRRPKLC